MAACKYPLLNERASGGLRREVCAAACLHHFYCFSFVLQWFSYLLLVSFWPFWRVVFGSAPGSAPSVFITFRCGLRRGLRQFLLLMRLLNFPFVSCCLYRILFFPTSYARITHGFTVPALDNCSCPKGQRPPTSTDQWRNLGFWVKSRSAPGLRQMVFWGAVTDPEEGRT